MNRFPLFITLAFSLSVSLISLCHAETEHKLSPAEFVTQSVSPDAPVRPFGGSAVEKRIRLAKRAKSAYAFKFDLSGLPAYKPKQKVSGKLRIWGNNYVGDSGLAQRWQAAFAKYQPDVEFEMVLPSAAVAGPALSFGLADIGMNHELSFYDNLGHLRVLGYEPTGFSVVTGSYDISGWQNSLAIIVNKDNPLTQITMQQLDGVFGSQRAGGWLGTTWMPEYARGPEDNIRDWGGLGLKGEWADKPINTYGYSLRYATSLEFSTKVLQSSDKWNENLLAYGNYVAPDGSRTLQAEQIMKLMESDRYGMAYVRWQSRFEGKVKVLKLAKDAKSPYYVFNVENLQARKYPLWGDQSFWVSIKPGTKIDPETAEFIRFVLSREGQQLVMEDGKYLPLPADAVKEQLARLASFE